MTPLPPWANGPFELITCAERHLRAGDDFGRRIALIIFDDAIEVSISTYLTLHPIQRGGRAYERKSVQGWLDNYHTKLDFVREEVSNRKTSWEVEYGHIIWAHDLRNEQYHGGKKGIPDKDVLSIARRAALWIFGLLFEVPEVEQRLDGVLAEMDTPAPPQRDKSYDDAIDQIYGIVEVGDQAFLASEVLFSVDYEAYREVGARLCEEPLRIVSGRAS
jgi:hypothetical protein